ncbi:hypothetical protein K402DRAFT_424261 [Aulographum hederae CBS 113979]|uniref:DNA polymerase n=1 Tax=Aulographum hederae CBS 113979 TaxID=1176131 RepID=A0A6G1GPL3_9PEZI|nr:hypothetical protein K402DRAFT_424261 [Aulographum hederae CBS 113979]
MESPLPFRFRLNCIDHYQAAPSAFDPQIGRPLGPSQRHNAPPVPVIRVFGATETGQKVCAHIHGALPYLFLEYAGSIAPEAVYAYIRDLRLSINHALATSYRRNPYDGKAIFVGHITLVKGVPFFGYHVGYKPFLKIYLLNPIAMTRFTDLLHQGAIMNQTFQPYESHLQFLLQWMCDFNLYGCSYIECSDVKFRDPVPDYLDVIGSAHRWHTQSIKREWISNNESFPRQSHCSIEIDVRVQDILNRNEVHPRPLHHDFLERFSHLGSDDKYVHSMAGLWRDETRRRKLRMGLKDPSSNPFPPEVLVSMSADPRNTSEGGWTHEQEFRERIQELIGQESVLPESERGGFDDFAQANSSLEHIQTILESVEDLFSNRLAAEPLDEIVPLETLDGGDKAVGNVDSDAALLDYDELDGMDSDEDIARAVALSRRKPGPSPANSIDNAFSDTAEEKLQQGSDPLAEVEEEEGSVGQSVPLPGVAVLTSNSPEKDQEFEAHQISVTAPTLSRTGSGSRKRKRVTIQLNSQENGLTTSLYRSTSPSNGIDVRLPAIPAARGIIESDSSHSQAPLSQASLKAHDLNPSGFNSFPIVKHPHDPATQFRLSQRSDHSNSQKSMHLSQKSLEPAISRTSPKTPWSGSKYGSFTERSPNVSVSEEAMKATKVLSKTMKSDRPMFIFGQLPPTAGLVADSLDEYDLPPQIYQEPYYSNEHDVPERKREYGGQDFIIESTALPYLPLFGSEISLAAARGQKPPMLVDNGKEERLTHNRELRCSLRNWQLKNLPPSRKDVEKWQSQEEKRIRVRSETKKPRKPGASQLGKQGLAAGLSQIEGPTQKHKHGFKFSQKQSSTSVHHETQYMSIMSLEVHVNARDNLTPDPAEDEIACVFWGVQADDDDSRGIAGAHAGILALSEENSIAAKIASQVGVPVHHEDDELEIINHVITIVREYDPDILTGYEVHNGSWGYLMERARLKYEYNLCDEISRMKNQSHGRFGKEADSWGFAKTSTIRVTGRHMINIWRAMRSELNLLQYTMENVVFHLLRRRIPHYTFEDLTTWYKSPKPRDLAKVINYFLLRVRLNLEILEANELISRTSEQARLLGVDFFSVFSRGSQFKVESLMFRIAKAESFVLVSPSRKQVGAQNALECLPLVMEPQSAFYNSPLLVLDFQSLYPSVMIAYNYCYSTCLGRVTSWRGTNKLGFTDFEREPGLLNLVKDYVNVAPNGLMYVRPEMRKSLLAKMLGEILETRVMVKSGMKVDKDDRTLQQLLNNRQLALKLIANVTYGYTSASFSGRMPCAEIADSIVQTGRETLEKAIALIHATQRWGAEVVYGDTDSLFVYLKGRTKDQAFAIGNEIAEAVTNTNPRPIKLKFEKVYHPCVLLAKKRYVGFKYEHPKQEEPEFDAKGIETVRRDGTPAEQKIEEKALKILFRTQDLSQVKDFFQSQCRKLMTGRVSIQDFLFAKEVKLGTYSDKGLPPPGAMVAAKKMLKDKRLEPQYGERIPYVVVTGAPGSRLGDRCVDPEVLLSGEGKELDAEYYISKNWIPPLERIFNLMGANVRGWWEEMPKVVRVWDTGAGSTDATTVSAIAKPGNAFGKTLESYLKSSSCIVCKAKLPSLPKTVPAQHQQLAPPLCRACLETPHLSLLALRTRIKEAEERVRRVEDVCRSCSGLAFGEEVRCDSRDCPVFWTRGREKARLRGMGRVSNVVEALEQLDDW